jgi:hypothetical protein
VTERRTSIAIVRDGSNIVTRVAAAITRGSFGHLRHADPDETPTARRRSDGPPGPPEHASRQKY